MQQPLPFSNTSGEENSRSSLNTHDQLVLNLFALNAIKGIGEKTLVKMFDDKILHNIWTYDESELGRAFADISSRIPKNAASLIVNNGEQIRSYAKARLDDLVRKRFRVIFRGEQAYPQLFEDLEEPPRWLFVMGKTNLLNTRRGVGVVGTRNPSSLGYQLAERIAQLLVQRNIVLISGMADGIDNAAHSGAVSFFGETIAVLGHGFDAQYASHHSYQKSKILQNDGLVITEYLPESSPSKEKYLRRNELLAALSRAIIPVESPSMQSGTGATIRRAMKLGRPIIGIEVSGLENGHPILATKNELVQLNCKVFELPAQSNAFWNEIERSLHPEKLDNNPRPRQQRFFKKIANRILKQKDVLSIQEEDIDLFAKNIILSLKDFNQEPKKKGQ